MVHEVLELCCFEWFQNDYDDEIKTVCVLELCCFEWFQNTRTYQHKRSRVLELCCFEWFQNMANNSLWMLQVLELCCFEWFQNLDNNFSGIQCFRAVLFRMVPKHIIMRLTNFGSFRAVLLIERAYKSACFFV